MKHIILIDNPQQLTDEDLNTLYNAADVGINTTQGAGFELTTFEHGGIGIPQIATLTGGIRDFLDNESGCPITPIIQGYTDMTTDGCNGKYEMCSPEDFADAIEKYYADDELRKYHGQNARTKMLTKYKWEDIGEKLYKTFLKVADRKEILITEDINKISLDDINILEDVSLPVPPEPNINVNKLKKNIHDKVNIKERLQAKLAAKKNKIKVIEEDEDIPVERLLKMKSKIDKLLETK
jgi:hypothetical protein